MRRAIWATGLSLLGACGGASVEEAKKELEADGYADVHVEPTDEAGKFRFSATNAEGKSCTGSITTSQSTGGSTRMVSSMCR